MKKLVRIAILIHCMLLSLYAMDDEIATVKAVPRWPWNGLVDITYSIHENIVNKNGQPAVFGVNLTGYDHDRKRSIFITSISSADGNSVLLSLAESGKTYKVVWDASKDYPTLNASAFSVAISLSRAYLVVNLQTGTFRYADDLPDLSSDTCRTTELWLRRIPAGTFIMGSPEDELGRNGDETQHRVTLTEGYYIGVFEVTQWQWKLVTGGNPSNYRGDTRPVEGVSLREIRGSVWSVYGDSFLGKLRAKTGGLLFDLPTEAQWEYACRAGTTTSLNSGKNLTSTSSCPNMSEVGRYDYNRSDGKGGYSEHTKVGSYLPNAWGLYDMHGNVCEWCLDRYGNYPMEAVSDPTGAASGGYNVLRGGCWNFDAQYCRSARRRRYEDYYINYYHGFRVVCVPPGQ